MITLRKSENRGYANHGWLEANHTFSFAGFHDEEFMGFGPLRVLNQDRIEAGAGFATHGHRDMEITTYVIEGSLEHKDNMGNGSRIRPGEVQLMSAGNGVLHSEHNGSNEKELRLLQMWVQPEKSGGSPRYEQKDFGDALNSGGLQLVVSSNGRDGSLRIGQDASMFAGRLRSGEKIEHHLGQTKIVWLHVATGSLIINGLELGPGDGAGIKEESTLKIDVLQETTVILWEFVDQ